MDMADKLLDSLRAEVAYLESLTTPMPDPPGQPSFHH